MANVDEIPRPVAPINGSTLTRSVGIVGGWPEASECHAFLEKSRIQRTYAYATWLVAEAASILTGTSDRSRRCDHGRDFG
jgi:hypothetical protein